MAPKMPKALPRSAGLVNVTVSVDSAAGASIAPNAPWIARPMSSIVKLLAAPPSAEASGEAHHAEDQHPLAADQVREPAADQQQSAEGQRVGGHHPLPVRVVEPQVMLGGRQRDVHHRGVKHHHQLCQADDGKDQPAATVVVPRLAAFRRPSYL